MFDDARKLIMYGMDFGYGDQAVTVHSAHSTKGGRFDEIRLQCTVAATMMLHAVETTGPRSTAPYTKPRTDGAKARRAKGKQSRQSRKRNRKG